MAILRKTKRATNRAMCGVKLLGRRISKELMNVLGIENSSMRGVFG